MVHPVWMVLWNQISTIWNSIRKHQLRCSCRQPANNNPVLLWSDESVDIGFEQMQQVGECLRFPVLNDSLADAANCANETVDGSSHTEYCYGTCNNANVMHILASNLDMDAETEYPRNTAVPTQLWLFVLLMVIAYGSMPVIDSIGYAMCYALLGEHYRICSSMCCRMFITWCWRSCGLGKNTHRFGKQRLWGSCGWGAVAMLSGFMVDQMSRGQALKDYSGVFYLAVGFLLCDMLAMSRVEVGLYTM